MLKFRHNVMNVSTIHSFESVIGGVNNNCKDVYFVRAVGTNATYINDITQLDNTLLSRMNGGKGYYCRLNGLPRLQSVEDTEFYSACYLKWIESNKKEVSTHTTKENRILMSMLGNACCIIEDIYRQQTKQVTESIIKNLIVKMLFWYDSIFSDGKFIWNENMSLKIVAANIEKKHEYLFFYLITLLGGDVLLLQSRTDITAEEDKLGLSVKFVLGDYSDVVIPKYQWHSSQTQNTIQRATTVDSSNNDKEQRIKVHIPKRASSNSSMASHTSAHPVAMGNVVTTGHNEGAEKSFEELAQLASSVVMITIHGEKGEELGSGSGIMIGQAGYILTNNHVACGGRFYSVRIEDDETVYTTDEVIKYNPVLDLAIIRIDRRLNPIPVYCGTKKLVRGQKVVAIGSPLGLFNSVSDGIISGFRKFDNVDMIQFTAPTSPGSSGGAVLNMQGEVIGISTGGMNAGQNINLAMGYECVNLFIKGFT